MEGSKVRSILKANGFIMKDIAEAMGETTQNLNSMLNAQDIKSGVLERIARALKKDVRFFYGDKENSLYPDGKLIEIIESQQQTIANLSNTITNLTNEQCKKSEK
jgi:transcriptional regulator with XRE-family HTH domain